MIDNELLNKEIWGPLSSGSATLNGKPLPTWSQFNQYPISDLKNADMFTSNTYATVNATHPWGTVIPLDTIKREYQLLNYDNDTKVDETRDCKVTIGHDVFKTPTNVELSIERDFTDGTGKFGSPDGVTDQTLSIRQTPLSPGNFIVHIDNRIGNDQDVTISHDQLIKLIGPMCDTGCKNNPKPVFDINNFNDWYEKSVN